MKCYICKTFNTNLSAKKLLNYVMDDGNIVCWESKEDALKFIKENGFEDLMVAEETDTDDIKRELEEKGRETVGLKIMGKGEIFGE